MEWGIPLLGPGNPLGSYLVTPTSRERFSQWLPVEKGTGEPGQKSETRKTPSSQQKALRSPESWNPWSQDTYG